MRRIELTLPEWVFWDAHSHEGNPLGDRTVIEHVQSASVFEIFDRDFDHFQLKNGVLSFKFKNNGMRQEKLIIALHHSRTLDPIEDREMPLGVMKKNVPFGIVTIATGRDRQDV